MTYIFENGLIVQATAGEIKAIAERWAQKLDVKVLFYKNIDERKWHPAYYREGLQDHYGKRVNEPSFNYYS